MRDFCLRVRFLGWKYSKCKSCKQEWFGLIEEEKYYKEIVKDEF